MTIRTISLIALALAVSLPVGAQSFQGRTTKPGVLETPAAAKSNTASGSLVVTLEVRTAILLTVTTPLSTDSGGGLSQASVAANFTPDAIDYQAEFTTRAITTSNPDLTGYRLFARLAPTINGTAAIDGIALSQHDVLISDQLPYGQDQTHALNVNFGMAAAPLSVVLTARPR